MQTLANFINGEFIAPISGHYIDNYAPATGKVYALIPNSDARDVLNATAAARAAFPAWSGLSAEERSRYLEAIADAIERRAGEFADAESRDTGKPIHLARQMDIDRVISNFRFFATAPLHFTTETHANGTHSLNYTLRQPLGVVACISPWNLPLYLLSWKIAPALAVGNCVVAKPSELSPYTAYLLGEICQEVGLPKGVLNIIQGGVGAGESLVRNAQIKAISFTGSTATGARIAANAAPVFKKLSLELGGKNPTIVFADADYEKALEGAVKAAFTNQGEICLCGSRLLVQKDIYERFKNDFVKKVNALQVGDPQSPKTDIGALISEGHMKKVLSYIDLAKEEGGKIIAGGEALQMSGTCKHGWFVAPTVIEGLWQECRTNQEEIFGPVVTIQPFDTVEEAIRFGNATQYGLAANVWTSHLPTANRLANELEMGIVWINTWLLRDLRTPFGGVKNSGVGREGGWEALRFFTESKNICIKTS